MRCARLATAIVLMCAALAALAQEQPVRRVLGGERLRVLHWPEHQELAQLALREGDDALRRLEGLLDVELAERVDVYIVRSRAEFDEVTGIENKPWVLGRAFLRGRGQTDVPYRVVVKPMGTQRLPGLLTHELAHVVIWDRFGKNAKPHGPEFRTLMRQVHLAEKATHNLPVEHLRRKQKAYLYLHRCSLCSYQFTAQKARRNTYCRQCGPEMTWDIFRLPNTPAGQCMMKRMLEG